MAAIQQPTVFTLGSSTSIYCSGVDTLTTGSLVVAPATSTTLVSLTVDGHIVTGNSSTTGNSTTAAINANAGTGQTLSPACQVTGDDTSGQVTFQTGTSGWAAGTQCTITFASPYTSLPHTIITNANSTSLTPVGVYVQPVGSSGNYTGFTINFIAHDTAQNTYILNYFNAQ